MYVKYKRSLVKRIDDLMDLSFSMDWKALLCVNNTGKRGHPFTTQNAFITFPAKLREMYSVIFRSIYVIARIFSIITVRGYYIL
jgi:hypothetical protein